MLYYLARQHSSGSHNGLSLLMFVVQQACGFEYTSKLQRMFQDIGVSKDLNEQFKKHLTNSEPLDCKTHTQNELTPDMRQINSLRFNCHRFDDDCNQS